jgi:hypothetical protein
MQLEVEMQKFVVDSKDEDSLDCTLQGGIFEF